MKYTKDLDTVIRFRFNRYHYEKLKKIADDNNISVSILCRNIITAYLAKELYNANK